MGCGFCLRAASKKLDKFPNFGFNMRALLCPPQRVSGA
jgi:hypothetical protein